MDSDEITEAYGPPRHPRHKTPETFQKMQTHEKQTWLRKFTIKKKKMSWEGGTGC